MQSPPDDPGRDIIASLALEVLDEIGSRRSILVWIGRPVVTETGTGCPCGIEHIGPDDIFIYGEGSMQALALASQFLHRRLSDVRSKRPLFMQDDPEPITQEFLDVMFSR